MFDVNVSATSRRSMEQSMSEADVTATTTRSTDRMSGADDNFPMNEEVRRQQCDIAVELGHVIISLFIYVAK